MLEPELFPKRSLIGLSIGFGLATAVFHLFQVDHTAALPPPPSGERALDDFAAWREAPAAANDLRIAVIGASLTAGFPYGPVGAASYATLLGVGLTEVLGNVRVDARPSGMAAEGSGGIAERARAVLALRPDVLCVTLGSNENGNRVFAGRAIVPSGLLDWFADHLSRGRALLPFHPMAGYQGSNGSDPRGAILQRLSQARPGRPVVDGLPVAVADQQAIVGQMRREMARLAADAAAANVPLVFCIAPDNLAGAWPHGMTESIMQLDLLVRAIEERRNPAVLEHLEELLADWPNRADLHFARGLLLHARGDEATAKTAFEKARELDPVPLRVTGRIIRGITEEAARLRRPCIVFDRALGDVIPDPKLFLDSSHLTTEGHVLVAARLAEGLAGEGLIPRLPAGWRDRFEAATNEYLERHVDSTSREFAAARMNRASGLMQMLFGNFRDALPLLHHGVAGLKGELATNDARFSEWAANWIFCVAGDARRLDQWEHANGEERAARLRRLQAELWEAPDAFTIRALAERISQRDSW